MTDYKRLARRAAAAEGREQQRAGLTVLNLADGLLAICRVCPKYHCDIRRASHPVWHQAFKCESVPGAHAWWQAHSATDMHQHYLSDPRGQASWWRRAQAQAQAGEWPTGGPLPFPHGIDRRLIQGGGKPPVRGKRAGN